MQNLSNLKYNSKTKKNKKRVGRGPGAGQGKTAGRGHKGQNSRTGGGVRPGFEGGQNPLYRRLPKEKGFKNTLFKKDYVVVNVKDLSKLGESEIKVQKLIDDGFMKSSQLFKVLGDGELNSSITVEAHAFSKSALQKIEKAGGKAVKCAVS